jgi:hypothetical protein
VSIAIKLKARHQVKAPSLGCLSERSEESGTDCNLYFLFNPVGFIPCCAAAWLLAGLRGGGFMPTLALSTFDSRLSVSSVEEVPTGRGNLVRLQGYGALYPKTKIFKVPSHPEW